jgi:TRAP-type C4-dicarboxylate transport system substrate-binding protein
MKHRTLISAVLMALLVATLPLLADAGAKRTLKLGTILPADNILTQNAQEFAKKVTERTKGEVEVVVYPNSQLGNERDLTEGLQLGTVEMAEVSGGVMSAFAPEAGLFSLPFVFNGWDHLDKVLRSPVSRTGWARSC